MIHLISLNELVLPKFFFLTLLGRSVKVLRVAPFVPKTRSLLQRAVDWAIRTGRAEYAITLAPELELYWEFDRRFYFKEAFKKYEPWQNRYYGFDRQSIVDDPVYGYGYKQMTCSYTFWKVIEVYLIDAIEHKPDIGEYRVHGVLEDTLALGRDTFGPDFAKAVKPLSYPMVIVRAGLMFMAMVFSLAWLVRSIRLSVVPERIDIAFERLNDPREFELFKEISEAGRFLLIYRSAQALRRPIPLPEGMDYVACVRTDGRFAPAGALAAAAMAVGHIIRLGRRHRDAPPALLYEMLSLPFKRLLVRGLLNRYRPGFFISRDEYNVDHIMRRAELRRYSIKSIGLSNGLFPCFSELAPNVRYVSYDVYFSYAATLFPQYHVTWAPDMELRTIGTYSVPREKLSNVLGSRGEDIVFTFRVAWSEPEMVRMVRAVAMAFPNHTVRLQLKRSFVSDENTRRLISECGEGLDNFVYTTENVYDLLNRAKYHVSDISTFVAEAIRSGMITFMADLLDQEFNCYRLFPGLCTTKAEDLVEKLRALETGEATYPHKKYFELLDCEHGEIGYDLLRNEIGLAPMDSAA
ncbi:MAG: hypothetical protein HQ513_08195 [Rhodospirillales bacterium]|nr:hypothetical protein [Rhodospirillales bacterium]